MPILMAKATMIGLGRTGAGLMIGTTTGASMFTAHGGRDTEQPPRSRADQRGGAR